MVQLFTFVFLFSVSAVAIEIEKCADEIRLAMRVTLVEIISPYVETPGWKEAHAQLNSIDQMDFRLKLISRNQDYCQYRTESKQSALLVTYEFQSSEEPKNLKEDQLVLSFEKGGSEFISYIPIKSYETAGIELFETPSNVKIKALLYFESNERWQKINMGQISIVVK